MNENAIVKLKALSSTQSKLYEKTLTYFEYGIPDDKSCANFLREGQLLLDRYKSHPFVADIPKPYRKNFPDKIEKLSQQALENRLLKELEIPDRYPKLIDFIKQFREVKIISNANTTNTSIHRKQRPVHPHRINHVSRSMRQSRYSTDFCGYYNIA